MSVGKGGEMSMAMVSASVEVAGPDSRRNAEELRGVLATAVGAGESVSPVEVHRDADFTVAVIGLVFSGVGTAKTIWDWWQARRDQDRDQDRDPGRGQGRGQGLEVRILMEDGTVLNLSTVDGHDVEIAFKKRATE